jgi:DNA-binding NtrC family response regulator
MKSSIPILLLGESGTGKEVLARATHAVSERRGAFVPVNCGGVPDALVESQFFGHARGAFSGAVRDEPGFVRASDGGTLFLDEVGDLPRASQAALLRVLEEGEVLAVGGARAAKVDLRLVSATNQAIDPLGASGFRRDLYARLGGYVHRIPPLRQRREDIGLVVADVLRELAPERASELRVTPDLGRALFTYSWPLNVRELRHALAAALVFATDGVIELAHVPPEVAGAVDRTAAPSSASLDDATPPVEVRLRSDLVAALTAARGNVTEVARAMGRTRMQIHRWMRRFGVDPEDYRVTR